MDLPLEELLAIEHPYRRRLTFAAVLQEALRAVGEETAIVGGHAVEAYTLGDYATADVDLVVFSKARATSVLEAWGFNQSGRVYWHEGIGVAVDLIGERLAGDWQRTVEVGVHGHVARVIGPEDLIIDRLNACVHWQSPDHCAWAASVARRCRDTLDLAYLRQRAGEEGVTDALDSLLDGLHDAQA